MRSSIVLTFGAAVLAVLALWTNARVVRVHAMQSLTERIDKYPIEVFVPGHEFRQDDWPSIAVGPDGSAWVAWLSFAGDRDDVGLRRYRNGKWENLQWVPATSGDNMMPQVAIDSADRVWVV